MCQFISQDDLVKSWDRENCIFPKLTKMRSIFGQRIDYNGVGVLRGQRHISNPAKINPSNHPGITDRTGLARFTIF